MKSTTAIVREMTNEELHACFNDICTWRDTGILRQDSPVRTTHRRCEEVAGADIDLRMTEQDLLFIMAERFVSWVEGTT